MHLYECLVHADEFLHQLFLLIVDGSCCCQVLFYLSCRPVILHNASALALHKPFIHGPAWFPGRADYVFHEYHPEIVLITASQMVAC